MSEVTKKKEPGIASMIIVLTAICLVIAGILGAFNNVTAPAIEANTQKTIQDSLAVVLPGPSEYTEITDQYTGGDPYVTGVYQGGDAGYVVRVASPNGFSGTVDMMVGFDTAGLVTGISIVAHAETSGLGANATKPEWQAQFAGLEGEVKVQKDGGQIVALTGSTITSRAVCDGVNIGRAAVESLG